MRSDIAGTCLDKRDEIDALARLGEDEQASWPIAPKPATWSGRSCYRGIKMATTEEG
jgi:hypothetical protein